MDRQSGDEILDRRERFIRQRRRQRRRKRILRFILLLLILGLIYLFAFKTEIFLIKDIRVEGNINLSKNTIITSSTCIKGENIFKINKEDCEESINNLSYIKTVRIRRKLPSTILIEVEEREEIAVLSHIGAMAYIDDETCILRVEEKNGPIELPQVFGLDIGNLSTGDFIIQEDDKGPVDFFKEARTGNLLEEMKYINFTDRDTTMIELKDKTKIAFGPLNDIEYKLSFLKEILKDIERKEIKAKKILLNRGDNPVIVVDD